MENSFVGSIFMWAGNRVPNGWKLCDGSLLPLEQYQILYAVIGTTYGGNGTTNFALPKLTAQFPMGAQNPLVTGQSAGALVGTAVTTAQLVADNLPAHDHPATVSLANVTGTTTIKVGTGTTGGLPVASNLAVLSGTGSNAGAAAIYLPSTPPPKAPIKLGGITTTLSNAPIATAGANVTSNVPVNIVTQFPTTPPAASVNYIICVEGVFPTRN